MDINIERMEKESVGRLLLSYSIPAMVGMIVNALYNVVDRVFVGRGVDTLALSGVTYTFPISMIVLGLAMLVGIGGATLLSIKLGEKKIEEAEKIIYNSFVLAILISFFLSSFLFIFMKEILFNLGARGEVFNYAYEFLTIMLFANIFQIISFVLNSLLRSAGRAKTAMVTLLFGAGLNIVLNPIFIFIFKLGVKGSALATLISMFLSFIWVFLAFRNKSMGVKLKFNSYKIEVKTLKNIALTGIGPFIMQSVAGFIIFIFNYQLNIYGGDYAVAAFGIINSIFMLFAMPVFGINQAVQPIIGYNYGAEKKDRILKTLKLGIISATFICTIGTLIIFIFAENILQLFTKNNYELINIGKNGIKIFTIMFPIVGFQIISVGFFQALRKIKVSTFLSLLRQVILLIPLLFVLPIFFKLNGIWLSGPTSDFFSFLFTILLLTKEIKRINSHKDRIEVK